MSNQSNAGGAAPATAAPVAEAKAETRPAPAPQAALGTPNPYMVVARKNSTEFVRGVFPITPDDVNALPQTALGIWVGGAGAISVVMADGSTAVLSGIVAGQQLPFVIAQVKATGTTATLLVGLR